MGRTTRTGRCAETWIALGTAAWLAGCTPSAAPGTVRQSDYYSPPTPTPVGILSPQVWVGCLGGDVARVSLGSDHDGSVLKTTFGLRGDAHWSVRNHVTQSNLRLDSWRGTAGGVVLRLTGGGKTIWYAVPTPPPPPSPPPPWIARIRATTEYGRELELMGWGLPTDYHHRTPAAVLLAPTTRLPDRQVRAILPTKWKLTPHFGLLRWRQIESDERATGGDFYLTLQHDFDTIEYASVRGGDAYPGSADDAKQLALEQISKFGGLPRDATLAYEQGMGYIAVPLARLSKSVGVRSRQTGYILAWEHTNGLADDQIRAIVEASDGVPFVSLVSWRWHELGDTVVQMPPVRKSLSPLDAYAVSSCFGWEPIAADDRLDPLHSVAAAYWSDPGTNVAKSVYVFRYSRSGLARLVDVDTGEVLSTARFRPALSLLRIAKKAPR